MDTVNRVNEIIHERNISLYKLSQLSGVPYSTLKDTMKRGRQLSVDTIEMLCAGLQISMAEFFTRETERKKEEPGRRF